MARERERERSERSSRDRDDDRPSRDRDRDRDRGGDRDRDRGRSSDDVRLEDDDAEGVSLSSEDAVEGGGLGLGPGRTKFVKVRFLMFDYKKKGASKSDLKPALVVDMERDGEKAREPYSVGSGWGVTKNGLKLISRSGQGGLSKSCNAMILLESLEDAGMPRRWMKTPDQLDGCEFELIAKPIERDFGADKGGTKKKSLLVVKKAYDAPWDEEGGSSASSSKGKGKGKKDKDDDDDDERPRKGKSRDEEDEAPRKGKGKGRDADDDKSNDDAEIDEEGIEAMLDVLKDGPIKVKDLEDEIRAALKGNKQANVIAARCTEDEFLELEKGWSYDAKKGRVELD